MPSESPLPPQAAIPPLKIAYVPGVTPGKWISRWDERRQRGLSAEQVDVAVVLEKLADGSADLVFLRIPEEGFRRPDELHAIPLYREQPVVAAPKDHPVAAFDDVALADLAGENIMDPADLGGAGPGLEVVASGAGLLILPMSVARIHSRRDVITRPVQDAPATRIAVAWRRDAEDPDIEEFIGIVRGRTANSSRQPSSRVESPKDGKSKAAAGGDRRNKGKTARTGAKPQGSKGRRPGPKR